MSETTITLPLSPAAFWIIAICIGVALLSLLMVVALPNATTKSTDSTWTRLLTRVGLAGMPDAIALFILIFWAGLGLTLAGGILTTIAQTPAAFATSAENPNDASLRWTLLTLTALTGALGAVIALPFTLIRTRQGERQTNATEQGLVTDRINTAVENLGAGGQVTRLGRTLFFTINDRKEMRQQWYDEEGDKFEYPEGATEIKQRQWENFTYTKPKTEIRIGAILALGSVARENPSFHVKIMQILCAYIRLNSPITTARHVNVTPMPNAEPTPDDWRHWRMESKDRGERIRHSAREDIKAALEVIGRRSNEQKEAEANWPSENGTKTYIFDSTSPSSSSNVENYFQ